MRTNFLALLASLSFAPQTTAMGWLFGYKSVVSAIRADDLEGVRKLLQAGGDPDQEDRYGQTPLFLIVHNNPVSKPDSLRMVQLLIRHGADVNQLSSSGENLLNCITRRYWSFFSDDYVGYRVRIAQLLIEGGTHIDHQGLDGDTPLHTAAKNRDIAMVELLIKHGARVTIRNRFGETPFDNAGNHIHELLKAAEEEDRRKREQSLVKGIPT